MESKIEQMQNLVNACNSVYNGKIIYANNWTCNLLNVLLTYEDLKNLIAICNQDFDYEVELKKATMPRNNDVLFTFPEDTKKMIALVFNVLLDISNGKINPQKFIQSYFECDDCSAFDNFYNTFITTFKKAVAFCFDYKLEGEEENEVVDEKHNREVEIIDTFIKQSIFVINKIKAAAAVAKLKNNQKADAEFILNTMLKQCENKDYQNLIAFNVSLKYVFCKNKDILLLIENLNAVAMDFVKNINS